MACGLYLSLDEDIRTAHSEHWCGTCKHDNGRGDPGDCALEPVCRDGRVDCKWEQRDSNGS